MRLFHRYSTKPTLPLEISKFKTEAKLKYLQSKPITPVKRSAVNFRNVASANIYSYYYSYPALMSKMLANRNFN